jgi:fumarate reductase subunit C
MSAGERGRRPYLPPFDRYWWLRQRYYRLYMLREATVLPLLFFIGCLIYGLISLALGELNWQQWLLFMQQPWVIALNLLTLMASLFHAKTFFELFPRVMPLAPAKLMVAGQWLATIAVSVGFLVLLGGLP